MRKLLLFSLLSLFFFNNAKLEAQSCFNISAGPDIYTSCLNTCFNITATVPDIRTSETYQVTSIPYNPYPFTSPLGNELTLLYQDDKFSDSFDLPFPFCFYGQTYNRISAGSNGVLTFDVLTNGGTDESYVISPGNALPYAGGNPNNIGIFYAPKASIFLAYYDMDPRTGQSPPERKIEWRVEGTAPCRKMVISFYHIDYYNSGGCQGTGQLCTMQAVLYEGTGLIDVFYENKPACVGYQGGLSIAGLQNAGQNQAVWPAGKNGTVWTSVREGYRYVPAGPGSLLNRVELYKNGSLISTATTASAGGGLLNATFNNVCQPEDSVTYVVRAFYQSCNNPAIETEGSDTLIVFKTLNPIATTIVNPLCNGGNGTVTVTSPVAPNVEYSITGGTTWQLSPVFNVPAGTYTLQARVVASLCGGSTSVTVTEPPLLTAFATPSIATCVGNDGSLDITAGGGTPAYQYSINNGVSYQAGNVFNNLAPGNYNNIKVKDANGCIANTSAFIPLNDTMRLELGPDSTICFGSSITLLPQTNPQTNTFKWTPATWLNYDTAKNPVSTPLDTIKYYLTAKWGVCQRTDSIRVNVLHKPVAHAGNDTTICYKTNATLNGWATNLSGTVNFAWSPPDSLNTPNAASTIARMDTTRQFTLTVTDNYGCSFSVTDSMWVFMEAPVPAFAGNDTIAMTGKPHQLFGSGGTSYLWSPAQPLDNPFFQNPKAVLSNDTYFTLLVTDAIGCTATDGVFVKVYDGPEYYLPNAFTPNGDGLNDVFRPIPSGMKSTVFFRVFNRTGLLVFETNKWMEGWDGKFKGKNADQGTYVWSIRGFDVNGKQVDMQGTVILLR
jgi:gliding motility-associated-like protein